MKEIEKIIMVMMVIVLCLGTAEVKALILNDGGVHTIDWTIDDWVRVEDSATGDFTTFNLVDGGSITWWVTATDHSEVNIFDGSIEDNLWTYHYSQSTISGGSIAYNLNASNDSEVSISGGSIGINIDVRDNSQVYIFGSGFEIDGVPVGYGEITTGTIDEFGRLTGTLTGVLQTGDPLDNVYYIESDASIFLVPEPASLLLLSLGSMWLRRKNRV